MAAKKPQICIDINYHSWYSAVMQLYSCFRFKRRGNTWRRVLLNADDLQPCVYSYRARTREAYALMATKRRHEGVIRLATGRAIRRGDTRGLCIIAIRLTVILFTLLPGTRSKPGKIVYLTFWQLVPITVVDVSTGRPERRSSSVGSLPRWNSASHLWMVAGEGASSLKTSLMSTEIWFPVKSFEYNYLIMARFFSFLSMFTLIFRR